MPEGMMPPMGPEMAMGGPPMGGPPMGGPEMGMPPMGGPEMGMPPPNMQAEAAEGRGGDTVLAHLTPGEIVIPMDLTQDPEMQDMIQSMFEEFEVDMAEFVVGDPSNKINPKTGNPEFGWGGGKRRRKRRARHKKYAESLEGILGEGTAESRLLGEGYTYEDAWKRSMKAMGWTGEGSTISGSGAANINNWEDRLKNYQINFKNMWKKQKQKDTAFESNRLHLLAIKRRQQIARDRALKLSAEGLAGQLSINLAAQRKQVAARVGETAMTAGTVAEEKPVSPVKSFLTDKWGSKRRISMATPYIRPA